MDKSWTKVVESKTNNDGECMDIDRMGNSYHLSILGIFVGIRWTSDVIPHLTRRHCKDHTLSQSERDRKERRTRQKRIKIRHH